VSNAVSITEAPIITDHGLTDRLRGNAGFDTRWAAWQSRGRIHDRALQDRLLMLGGIAAVAAAVIVFLLLIR
jgi:hypothetical protein